MIERDGLDLGLTVLQLGKKGFELLRHDLGHLTQQRFAAQSVVHDYIATAFHLGEFAISPRDDVEFLTEQEVQCCEESLLPSWIPRSKEHIPDGFTRIKNEKFDSVFAFEVELHLKPFLRYSKAAYYFDGIDSKVDVVFWICDGMNLILRISEHLSTLRLRRIEIHHFVLLDDFRKYGWNCPTRSGREKNQKIRDIYMARARQGADRSPANPQQDNLIDVFFSSKKSP